MERGDEELCMARGRGVIMGERSLIERGIFSIIFVLKYPYGASDSEKN
jgi:hypothetical protein